MTARAHSVLHIRECIGLVHDRAPGAPDLVRLGFRGEDGRFHLLTMPWSAALAAALAIRADVHGYAPSEMAPLVWVENPPMPAIATTPETVPLGIAEIGAACVPPPEAYARWQRAWRRAAIAEFVAGGLLGLACFGALAVVLAQFWRG